MDINNILAFMAVATLLVISPGPNGMLIAKTVPLAGHKAGILNVCGFVAAFYVHGTLSVFGISVLLLQSGQAFFIFKMLGAAYLVWLGIKALKNALAHSAKPPMNAAQIAERPISLTAAFLEGFLTNMLNPKVSMFYLAAFPQFLSANSSALNAYSLVSAHVVVNSLWFIGMVFTLSKVKSATDNPKFKIWLNSITGLVFIGFGAKLALSKNG
ncbi:MAG: LysE family translocator [Gilvibacter sp.]|uniref:LysE family translocator n=1 Tax=Paraglaciecola sp. TaxID=1920173 RepID=UPI003296FC72